MAFGEGSQRLCGGGEGTISVWITGAACQLHRWDCLMMMRSTFGEDILRFWSRFKGWRVVVISKVAFCGWFSRWRSFEIFMQDLGDTMKLNLRLKSNSWFGAEYWLLFWGWVLACLWTTGNTRIWVIKNRIWLFAFVLQIAHLKEKQ